MEEVDDAKLQGSGFDITTLEIKQEQIDNELDVLYEGLQKDEAGLILNTAPKTEIPETESVSVEKIKSNLSFGRGVLYKWDPVCRVHRPIVMNVPVVHKNKENSLTLTPHVHSELISSSIADGVLKYEVKEEEEETNSQDNLSLEGDNYIAETEQKSIRCVTGLEQNSQELKGTVGLKAKNNKKKKAQKNKQEMGNIDSSHDGSLLICKTTGQPPKKRGRKPKPKVAFGDLPYRYSCEQCGGLYKTSRCLARHTMTHITERSISCSQCPKTFTTKRNLAAHTTRVHGQLEKKQVCSICKKAFLYECELRIHMRSHTGERPFVCDICGTCMARNRKDRHMLIHTGEKPYECEICHQRFRQAQHVKRHHQLVHLKEKLYQCSVCRKAYSSKYSLKRHQQQHWKRGEIPVYYASENGELVETLTGS